MDKIEKIRQEVGRLMELNNASMESTKKISRISAAGYYEALVDVENFLDTLSKEPDTPEFPETFEICLYDGRTPDNEKCTECSTTCSVRKEEPDKSIEEAAAKYAEPYISTVADNVKWAFKAGAEWQACQEYIRKDALLEWIKSEMNRLWELLPDADNASPTEMEIRYLGQYMQMETLEDKLNSI